MGGRGYDRGQGVQPATAGTSELQEIMQECFHMVEQEMNSNTRHQNALKIGDLVCWDTSIFKDVPLCSAFTFLGGYLALFANFDIRSGRSSLLWGRRILFLREHWRTAVRLDFTSQAVSTCLDWHSYSMRLNRFNVFMQQTVGLLWGY